MKVSVRYQINPGHVRDSEGNLQDALDERAKLENPDKKALDEWRERGKRFRSSDLLLRQFDQSEIKFSSGHDALLEVVDENPQVYAAELRLDNRFRGYERYVEGIRVIARDVPPVLKLGTYLKGSWLFVAVSIESETKSGRTLHIQMSASCRHEDQKATIHEWMRDVSDVLRASVGLPPMGTLTERFSAALPEQPITITRV